MGYHKMNIEDLYSIFKRWNKKQKVTQIALLEGFDRKTINTYIQRFKENGLRQDVDYHKKQVIQTLMNLLPENSKKQPVQELLKPHLDEIKKLLNNPGQPVKIITAFKIIKKKYQYTGSYETFKLYVKQNQLKKDKRKSTIRIELPPGREIQVDYGKVGTFYDSKTQKNKTLYAFCGILAHSRLPFIEFVFTQTQTSFVQSHINMFEHFEGVVDYISLDNLKSGVLKPDLYEPKINKTYQEMADYYDVFLNPCRVATPTDKGKIERFIQVAREIFLELKHIYPNDNLIELNKKVKKWCKEEYGMNEHGTTRIAPLVSYHNDEKKTLKSLPESPFEICEWKKAKVHPDQFITVNKKRYSLPVQYIKEEVWVKSYEYKLEIYHHFKLIRTYLIPNRSLEYEASDFPEVIREMMDGGYPKYLLNKARTYGENAYRLIERVLTPHAYLNSRRAKGILDILEKYHHLPVFEEIIAKAITRSIKLPKSLKLIFEEEMNRHCLDIKEQEVSETQKAMTRDIKYYLN